LEADPHLLAPLKLHYLRWVLFDDDTSRTCSNARRNMCGV
jgi:hypothetical protein